MEHASSGFFVLRTPLLPVETLGRWVDRARGKPGDETAPLSLCGEGGVPRDRFRTELLRLFEAEDVREALFLGSPVLEDAFRRDPQTSDSGKRRRLDAALTKYLMRMAGRCTPFGLFAGISVGTIAEKTELRIGPRTRYGRTTRIDMGYLTMLVDGLMRDPAVRDAVRYRPNSTLYVLGGRARYAEHRPGERARSYFLVSAEMDDALSSTLERARNGASRGELIRALVDDEFEAEEATPYIDELITNQVLVPELGPAVTGGDPMAHLADQLESLAGQKPTARVLRSVGQRLEALDRSGLGHEPEAYRTIAAMVESLPADANIEHLFQVDMTKPHETLTLSESLLPDMLEVADFLARFFGASQTDPMEDFRRAFTDRYAEREVPLLEVLDEECGIGFGSSRGVTADTSPLLAGIPFAAAPGEERIRWGPVQDLLLRRLMETRAEPESPLVMTTEDVAGSRAAIVLPPAFSIMLELLPDDGEASSPKFLWQGLAGPSGARLLGRFCHTSPDLLSCVCQHLRAEEELEPDKIYCEIAHLPEGRMGNVIARPLLREREIVFLARSGTQADRQIPLSDLRVSVRRSRVVLRSVALDREIVPRLSNAHNSRKGIGVYRFLGALQEQGYTNHLGWQWGPFERLPHLPRVVFRKAVLSPARWLVDRAAIAARKGAREDEAAVGFNDWAEQHRLPRWVGLREGDNVLPVDRENPMSLEAMLDATHGQRQFTLIEMPGFGTHGVVSGAEGTFANEIVVPFVRSAPVQIDADAAEAISTRAFDGSITKSFLPGSEWLFVRFHTAPGFADSLLTRTLRPFVRELVQEGLALNWFFIRYADPDFHIRLRILCNTPETAGLLVGRIRSIGEDLVRRELVTKIAYDTYDREVARYGGPAGIELCEGIFGADSEAVLDLVDFTPHDDGANARWQLTLCGLDALLDDLGFELEQRYFLAKKMAENYGRELNLGSARHQIQDKFRRERRVLMSLVNGAKNELADLQPALDVLARRSDRLEPAATELRLRSEAGRLVTPLSEIAGSLLHMHVNRMLPTTARAQEAILYQFLTNLYDSELSRSGRKKKDRQG